MRDPVERGGPIRLFLTLELLPHRHHFIGGAGLNITEDVRMARPHLCARVAGNIVDVKVFTVRFSRDVGVKEHLIEHVTKFFEQVVAIARLDGINEFVGLFDEVAHERLVCLLRAPRASVCRPQLIDDDR